MPNTPGISILMPVLRPHPLYFREAVASILRQTLTNWELIIVEDPSESSAAAILAEFRDSRIRHICNETRTSLVAQLNQGLSLARTTWVARMDADDVCETDRLAEQMAYLNERTETDVLGSQITIIDSQSAVCGRRQYPVEHEAILAAMPRYNPVAHPSVIYRRETVLAGGGYQYSRYPANEDYELWSRLALRGARFANHSRRLLRYRIHPNALKAERLHGIIRGTLEVKRMHWQGKMGTRGWLRFAAERGLLWLPASLVMRLFMQIQYRRD